MSTLDLLTKRNASFAANDFPAGLRMMPRLRAMIIGCADPRVDPAQVLGLDLGDAAIIRNVGGRVTPGTLQNMALLRMLAPQEGPEPGGEWTLIVLHHTDCGITRLVNRPEPLAAYLGVPAEALDVGNVTDPRASVASDVAALRRVPGIPAEWLVTGLVYDVETGLVDEVVPLSRLREPEPVATADAITEGQPVR